MVVVAGFVSAGVALVLSVCLQPLHPSFFDESQHILLVCFEPTSRHARNACAFAPLQCLFLAWYYFTPAIVLSRHTFTPHDLVRTRASRFRVRQHPYLHEGIGRYSDAFACRKFHFLFEPGDLHGRKRAGQHSLYHSGSFQTTE